jgi:hypothetical protein
LGGDGLGQQHLRLVGGGAVDRLLLEPSHGIMRRLCCWFCDCFYCWW